MQGDIFQLEDALNAHRMEFNTKPQPLTTPKPKTGPVDRFPVSIYTPEEYLFKGTKSFDDAELGKVYSQANYLNTIASAFPKELAGSPTWHSDDYAISEDDDDNLFDHIHDDHHTEISKSAAMVSEDNKAAAPIPITLTKKRGSDTTTHARRLAMSEVPRAVEAQKAAEVIAQGVARISGPLMGWWPSPVETQENDWDERFYH